MNYDSEYCFNPLTQVSNYKCKGIIFIVQIIVTVIKNKLYELYSKLLL